MGITGDGCNICNSRNALFDIVELTVFIYPKLGNLKLCR